jgi:hypothetical protein
MCTKEIQLYTIVRSPKLCNDYLQFYIFWDRGGRIQKFVYSKTGTRYTRSATIIDFIYAIILLYFKQYKDSEIETDIKNISTNEKGIKKEKVVCF